MAVTDDMKLTWCKKHQQWWVQNCPECMAEDIQAELALLRKIAEWAATQRCASPEWSGGQMRPCQACILCLARKWQAGQP